LAIRKVTSEEYSQLSNHIQKVSGITLGVGKEYLIETRLGPLLEEFSCQSYMELFYKARTDQRGVVERRIIDAISTNETYFFRDIAPFDLLQHKLIPDLIDAKTTASRGITPVNIRIWSAASSTGQEIYSIAIVLKELNLNPQKYRVQLLGTDISNAAITQASYGRYNKFEISRGLAPGRMNRFFQQDGDGWQVGDAIRATVTFQKLNLTQPFFGLGKFDIILCRNVAIYFSPAERSRLYTKIASVLDPNGYLLIGATESLTNDTDQFFPQKYLRSVFYQRKTPTSA
jgi:chemotaxis protein methyltransferase CheR